MNLILDFIGVDCNDTSMEGQRAEAHTSSSAAWGIVDRLSRCKLHEFRSFQARPGRAAIGDAIPQQESRLVPEEFGTASGSDRVAVGSVFAVISCGALTCFH
jgi:hypothetical protein